MVSTVYKVLWKKEDTLWSGGIDEPGMAMPYSVTEINYPKIPNSKLFAFSSLKDVSFWLQFEGFSMREVWEAEAVNAEAAYYMCSPAYLSHYGVDFWSYTNLNNHPCCAVAPRGTVFCDSLKLIREIK